MVQPIEDRVALILKIIFKTCSTNQNSAHGIYNLYHVVNDKSHKRKSSCQNRGEEFYAREELPGKTKLSNLDLNCRSLFSTAHPGAVLM